MLSNLSQTLHSSAKSKNKQVAKIWSIYLNKQKSGPKIRFPEGLENTPLKEKNLGFVNSELVAESLEQD